MVHCVAGNLPLIRLKVLVGLEEVCKFVYE